MSIEKSFFIGIKERKFPLVVITGVCRSGKTLLGNILATCQEAEYSDEPYTPMLLPMIVKSGKIDQEFAVRWMGAILSELFNDLLLLRAGNFRPGDLSSIWSKKSPEEISNRLINLQTRKDAADYAKQNNSQLVVTLSECIPFIDFLIKAMPKAKIVHVVRDPYNVAADVVKKKWFSDEQLKNPLMAQLYCLFNNSGSTWHLPWWVNDEEYDYFLQLGEFERGVYYWWSLVDKGLQAVDAAGCREILVRYEDMIRQPQQVFDHLFELVDLTPGSLTDQKLQEIRSDHISLIPQRIDHTLENRINITKEKLDERQTQR